MQPTALTTLVLAVALTWPSPGRAGTDPERTWFTLTTEHFAIHSYDGGEVFARRVASHAEEAWTILNPLYGWEPRETVHIVVVDDEDSANGFASVIPFDNIKLMASPPTMSGQLSDHDDWVKLLVFHEYSHILHMDQTSGAPDAVNAVMGKSIKPNQALPRWFTEGLAVWAETETTQGGRIGSSRFEMVLRMAVLADRLPGLSELTGPPLALPRGTSWYLYGAYVLDHMIRHGGLDSVQSFVQAYGRKLVPYGINIIARQTTGRDLVSWHGEFAAELRLRVIETVQRVVQEGRIEGRQLTRGGEGRAYPAFTPDGQDLVYVRSDGHGPSHLVRLGLADPQRATLLVRCDGGCGRFAVLPDGQHIVLSTNRHHRQVHRYRDLLLVPLSSGASRRTGRRLTHGARTREPALTANGRSVWTVRNAWDRTWLEAYDVQSGASVARWDPPPGARIDRPLPHPDGKRLFASMHVDGNRDLVEIRLRDGEWRRLTWGASLEIDPTLSPDGRWLVYASDGSGIYDLYARRVAGAPAHQGQTVRLTRVLGGAFEPAISPDGSRLVYVGWTVDGEELYELPFDPEGGRPVSLPDPRAGRSAVVPTAVSARRIPYVPWSTLLPRQWLPSITAGTEGTARIGLALGGQEITERIHVSLEAEWDAELGDVAAQASLGLGLWWPDIELRLGRYARDASAFFGDALHLHREEILYAAAEVSLPSPDAFVSMNVSLGLTGVLTRAMEEPPVVHTPDAFEPRLDEEGARSALKLSWSFRDVVDPVYGISPSQGGKGRVSLRLAHRALGAHATAYEVRYRLQGYLPLPWADDHVLSLGMGGGWAGGEPGSRGRFTLGGVPEQDLLTDLINETQAGSAWLRGYAPGALAGEAYQLVTGEYRLPLTRVRRGLDTLPIYARDLALALFADAGIAYSDPLDRETLRATRVGLGAELRMQTDLLFATTMGFRLGWAEGLGEGGMRHIYLLMAPDP